MNPSPQAAAAQRALGASTLALVVALAAIVAFLPPLLAVTLDSIPRTVLLGLAIAVGIGLHGVFLGIAAHRLGRAVAGWVALALLLFPVGSIAALILLAFFGDEDGSSLPAPGT